jgi:hypothetical protein
MEHIYLSNRDEVIQLSQEHHDNVNRCRRIVVQYDANSDLGVDFDEWIAYRFHYIDEPGSQIDSVWWDIGGGRWAVYPSDILERFEHPGLQKWWNQGIDWVQRLLDESKKRSLEVFWNHRVSEVDVPSTGDGLDMKELNPTKKAHPDWVIKTWWWQGLWNLAIPEVREYQLSILHELAVKYEFDGIQLDFARHVPCLPLGRQWEFRDHVTEFVHKVRVMLLGIEKKRGLPFLLSAKVPQNLEGCRADGFDVETWAQQNLVDILTLGSRSMDVDIAGFRKITAGRNIKLQPCLDDHHSTDGYRFPPIEFFRGVFGNWWQQGADSVVTFNWSNASPDICEKASKSWGKKTYNWGPISHGQSYHEIGSPETLAYKDKFFAVERRGGYPWAEGFFGRNDNAPLPAILANDGRPTNLNIMICDNIRAYSDKIKNVIIRAVLFGANEGDKFNVQFNGVSIPLEIQDYQWKDPQIFSPNPQPISGGDGRYPINPQQRLLRLDFTVPSGLCHLGENQVSISIIDRIPYVCADIFLEKLEIHVNAAVFI